MTGAPTRECRAVQAGFDVEQVRARFSDPAADRSTASRWSTWTTPPRRRSRARSSTPLRALLLRGQRQHPSRRALPFASGPPRLRGARGKRAALPQRAPSRRDHLRARRHRGHQPGGPDLRPRQVVGAGDEILITAMEHHSNIVPWQMLCEEKGAKLRVDSHQRQRRAASGRVREAARAARRSSSPSRTSPTRSARSIRCSTIIEWRTRTAFRCWSTAPRPCRISRWTCRRSTATSTSSPATRCTAPPASACSTASRELLDAMPPYQGGGDMISSVTFEKTTYNSCPTSSRPARRNIAGAIGLGRGHRLPERHRHGRDRRATSTSCWRMRRERSAAIPGVAHHRHGAGEGGRALVRDRRTSIRTTSAPSSTARASPFAPAITARSR